MTGKEKWLIQSPISSPSWEEQTGVLSSWADTAERPMHQEQICNILKSSRICAVACRGEVTFTAEKEDLK